MKRTRKQPTRGAEAQYKTVKKDVKELVKRIQTQLRVKEDDINWCHVGSMHEAKENLLYALHALGGLTDAEIDAYHI